MALNFLFVCSQNKWRSRTAEAIYRNDSRINVRSAGTSSRARKRISAKDLAWADLVLVMEKKHRQIIQNQYYTQDLPDIIVLDIPDDYQYMDEELIEIITAIAEDIISEVLAR